ncbi:MAG: MGH1-like glycoside hydrolase domain-containing protein [Gemmatimonadaceae bacterium]
MDPIELLARDDKWFLGSGDGIIFAPSFPVWLNTPGFWDEATIYQYQVGPLFTVTWLDHDGRELPLRVTARRWTPAELTVEYDLGRGITAREVRSVQPKGIFGSEWTVRSAEPMSLHAVAWTAQDTRQLDVGSARWDGALGFTRQLTDRRDVTLDVRLELAVLGEVSSWWASLSERSALQPHWRFAPFAEQWVGDRLPSKVRLQGITTDGFLYAGVHAALPRSGREAAVSFAMRVAPADDALRGGRSATPLGMAAVNAPRSETPIGLPAVGAGRPLPTQPLARASRRRWREFFAAVPHFTCSDPYLERYYWYRWYGLFLNSIRGGVGNYRSPTVCEGIGVFHMPITYSAQCHVRELRWMRDPEHARGVLRTIFDHQRPDGALHGRVYVNHLEGTDFYHANWGDAFEALDLLRPDDDFAKERYPGLARHAEWLVSTRDPDATGMFDVVDQYETGQEYMSRYQAVDSRADAYGWENRIRLKGIDVTVYAYCLFRALERLAPRVAADGEARHWAGYAARTARAVRTQMWNSARGMFSDVDPRTMRRTDVAAAVCFYPYFTDLATEAHVEGLERNLLNPSRFWTQYPVPSSALDDPLFSATAEWKGKRHVCPWNGRVWPMTNSHLIEALGRWASPDRPALRSAAGHLLQRFVHMMFHDGDLERANCFEHYNPFTGAASEYRGIDDYQHSWVADLIIRFCAGLQITRQAIIVDPLPLDVESFELRGVRVDDREVSVRLDSDFLTVTVDTELRMGRRGDRIEIAR